MTQADREYYYGRAEAELKRAQASECPFAVKAHYCWPTDTSS